MRRIKIRSKLTKPINADVRSPCKSPRAEEKTFPRFKSVSSPSLMQGCCSFNIQAQPVKHTSYLTFIILFVPASLPSPQRAGGTICLLQQQHEGVLLQLQGNLNLRLSCNRSAPIKAAHGLCARFAQPAAGPDNAAPSRSPERAGGAGFACG